MLDQHKEYQGIQWLEFDLLAGQKGLSHGVFLRHGGSSVDPYTSLNLSEYVGDDPDAVRKNRQAVFAIHGVPYPLSLRQMHGIQLNDLTHLPAQKEMEDLKINLQLPRAKFS